MFWLQSRLLFNIPELYNISFEKLWADEIIYQYEWRDFIPKCRDDWLLSIALVSLAVYPHVNRFAYYNRPITDSPSLS